MRQIMLLPLFEYVYWWGPLSTFLLLLLDTYCNCNVHWIIQLAPRGFSFPASSSCIYSDIYLRKVLFSSSPKPLPSDHMIMIINQVYISPLHLFSPFWIPVDFVCLETLVSLFFFYYWMQFFRYYVSRN